VELGAEAALTGERDRLVKEADELKLIFAAIAAKDDTNGDA
jgi:hypothetical protein